MEPRKLGLKELIAMGVGGMIGGGIFSVLGMAVQIAGHAAPLAFGIGGLIALAGGYSYVKLALAYHSDGASFTYLERAFPSRPNVSGIAGWTVIIGYIGTLALYAFTFGAYGADLLGWPGSHAARLALSASVLLFFTVINLRGARVSGEAEDVVVYTKIVLLALFAIIGLSRVRADHFRPLLDQGPSSVFMAGALIFVAYEGFQLITNAVCETTRPDRNVPRGIYGSIAIVSLIYLALAVVGVGTLTPSELVAAREYALAAAARPVLGEAGVVLVGITALLATSSAINATAFGAARMLAEMATEGKVPNAFSFRTRTEVPWVAVVALTTLALLFSLLGSLEFIAAFSSMTFLLVSIGVSIANLRLRKTTHSHLGLILLGLGLMSATVLLLIAHLGSTSPGLLAGILGLYATAGAAEWSVSRRMAAASVSPLAR